MTRGMLIVVEGADGTGKSTIVHQLAEQFGLRCAREPGGVPVCEKIRELLLTNKFARKTQALLFIASRMEFVSQFLERTLANGENVVLDRYLYSTLAYQAGVLSSEVFEYLHADMPVPDVLIYLEADAQTALKRVTRMTVFEEEGIEAYRQRQSDYQSAIDYARKAGVNTHVIDANESFEHVYQNVVRVLSCENPSLFVV